MEVISQSEVKTSVQTGHAKNMTLLMKNTARTGLPKVYQDSKKATLSVEKQGKPKCAEFQHKQF